MDRLDHAIAHQAGEDDAAVRIRSRAGVADGRGQLADSSLAPGTAEATTSSTFTLPSR